MIVKPFIIAVDFDGTIVEEAWPDIGNLKVGAVEALKGFIEKGYHLVLWTCRAGDQLEAAVSFLELHGIEFDHINESHSKNEFFHIFGDSSRKIFAHLYIDDRAHGANIDWAQISADVDKKYELHSKK